MEKPGNRLPSPPGANWNSVLFQFPSMTMAQRLLRNRIPAVASRSHYKSVTASNNAPKRPNSHSRAPPPFPSPPNLANPSPATRPLFFANSTPGNPQHPPRTFHYSATCQPSKFVTLLYCNVGLATYKVSPQPVGTSASAFRRLCAMPENVVREFTEKSAAYAKDAYGKAQAAGGETTKVMEQTYSAASKGAADFNLRLLEI